MNYRKKAIAIFVAIGFFSLLSVIPFAPHWLGICDSFVDYDCKDKFKAFKMVSAVILFFSPIIMLGALLTLLRHKSKESFDLWRNFTVFWIPLSVLLIVISPAQSDCFFGSGFICNGFDREGMIWFTAGIFFIVSLIIISVKSWKLRGK